ncbi:MAG: CapA family protein [Desulfomonile tiedjei]|nr:CapA family protein [Desulfomonile tiedjei]
MLVSLLSWLLWSHGVSAEQREIRLLFTGDVLLSRNVQLELKQRGTSPWTDLSGVFGQADLVVGNLEGAVGEPADCLPSTKTPPCFSIPEHFVSLLASGGFKALSIENNHNLDLGESGRAATIEALKGVGLVPLSYDSSPGFFHFDRATIGIVAVNLVPGRDGGHQSIPSIELQQKLRLAKNLANLVVVTVHWGSELLDWPNRNQREGAEWLISQGADLIIGHHPHVVQPPEMIAGKPVFFSLGNHLFDQKYLATKEGLIADCRINGGILRCTGIATQTAKNSFFPQIVDSAQHKLLQPIRLRVSTHVSGVLLRPAIGGGGEKGEISLEGIVDGKQLWQTRSNSLASITPARLDGKNEYLFTLEWHYSPIDGEIGLRPYVYSVTPQGLVARWRGSALAWPLLDAVILPDDERILCGLHRGDSFIDLKPDSKVVRVAAYRWNGFGFSGVDDPETTETCRKCFEIGNNERRPPPQAH